MGKKAKVVVKAKPTPQAETPSGSTPLNEMKKAIKALERVDEVQVDKSGVVIYWMRSVTTMMFPSSWELIVMLLNCQ